MMMGLCEVLNEITNPLIFMVAFVEFVLLTVSVYHLWGFRHRIRVLNSKEITDKGRSRKQTKSKVSKTIAIEINKDWEEFDAFLEDYQEKGCWYSAFSLIIQVFTLLGILGTVAGLYLSVCKGGDLYTGVEMALSTTIFGILFAVIYKLADVFIMSVFINYIEDGINRYEKIYKVYDEDSAMDSTNGKDK